MIGSDGYTPWPIMVAAVLKKAPLMGAFVIFNKTTFRGEQIVLIEINRRGVGGGSQAV